MAGLTQTVGTLSLLVIAGVGLAAIAYRLLPAAARRYRADGPLRHLGTLPLSAQCSIALVRAGKETLVLGLTHNAVTLLAKAPPEPADGDEQASWEM